jgi:[glutamine synthetase] adenylyltransferase / [glutamine synthetase]-adenylyl-L-tyrosine phosphorylase
MFESHMPDLPHFLETAAAARWTAFEETVQEQGLAWPHPANVVEPLKRAFAFSPFVARTAIHRPGLAVDLMASGDLTRSYAGDDYPLRFRHLMLSQGSTSRPAGDDPKAREPRSEVDFQIQLRLFRQREMMRIAVRDLTGLGDLNATVQDLSSLADTCLQLALGFLDGQQRRLWGTPVDADGRTQHLVVLGMGKLGANELNFSSDVDLMFAYPREGRTRDGLKTTTNEDYFIRLSRRLIQMIGAATADGFVFRVDTRLRPFGEAGPLAMGFSRMEDYYQTHGREWERYALIKARVVAGDAAAGGRLLLSLRPFVFRRYLDFNAFDSLRDMKQRIATEVQSKGLQDNIKIGPGGIREVEFFGQMFQLLRGGVQPELQARDIQTVLRHLVDKKYIPSQTGEDLGRAYIFLRRTENRLQAYMDQQTHLLPNSAEERLSLAAAMGFEDWAAFCEALGRHRQRVHHHFSALLGEGDPADKEGTATAELLRELAAVWQHGIAGDPAAAILKKAGFANSGHALRLITDLRSDGALRPMTAIGRERLARIMPLLLQAATRADHPEQVLLRLFGLIKSICRRTAYLSLLCEYPATLDHLVRLFEASPWIAALLSRHPVLLDELLDPRTLYSPPGRPELAGELRALMAGIPPDDFEHQIEALRIFKQTNVLRVAASDITSVLPLMRVSDHLSDIAEVVLDEVVTLSWDHLVAKHGAPACLLNDQQCRRGFAVIAYGKLGGLELGYQSDLDLVFLHAAAPGQTQGSPRPIDNAQLFARLGQRVLHILTAHTPAGILYETDMRLRPSGDSGLLVSHIEGFRQYQRDEAWTWEHQALIRARAISGDAQLCSRFRQIRREILTRPRDAVRLRRDVAAMRQKLRAAQKAGEDEAFAIKEDPGGIMDIEFLVQYLILRHAHRHPDITRWTDNVRQLQDLSRHGIIDQQTAFGLRRAYLILRATSHRLNLRGLPARVEKDHLQGLRNFVQRCWQRYLA